MSHNSRCNYVVIVTVVCHAPVWQLVPRMTDAGLYFR